MKPFKGNQCKVREEIANQNWTKQYEYLVSQGFSNMRRNLTVLRISAGNQDTALHLLKNPAELKQRKREFGNGADDDNDDEVSNNSNNNNNKNNVLEQDVEKQQQQHQQPVSGIMNIWRKQQNQADRFVEKQRKYDENLKKITSNKNLIGMDAQIAYLTSLGYDHQVNVCKILLKCGGDQQAALKEIQARSEKCPNKYKLLLLKGKFNAEGGANEEKNQGERFHKSRMHGQSDEVQGQRRDFKKDRDHHHSKHEGGRDERGERRRGNHKHENREIKPVSMGLGQALYPQMNEVHASMQNQNKPAVMESRSMDMETETEAGFACGIDKDALEQMQRSQAEQNENLRKEKELNEEARRNAVASQQNEKNVSMEQGGDVNSVQVVDFMKKNLFLISNGFPKASQNLNALLRANGNQQLALNILIENQLKKAKLAMAKKEAHRDQQARANDSDSDDSDSD